MVEERREVVSEEYVEPVATRDVVVERPAQRVVRESPTYVRETSPAYVRGEDSLTRTWAASSLIQTVVWAAVIIILLVVGILILVHYNII